MIERAQNYLPRQGRTLMRRRDGLSGSLQAALDGCAVIGVAWALVTYHIGFVTTDYLLALMALMGALAVIFDRAGIYRSHRSYTRKVFALGRSWVLAYMALAFLGYVTEQGGFYSRVIMGQLFVFGLGAHLLLHLAFYLTQRYWMGSRGDAANAIVIGQGDLANYLAAKVNANPWLGQRLIGKVTLDDAQDGGDLDFGLGGLTHLGSVSYLRDILKAHGVEVAYIVTPLESSSVLEDVYLTLLDKQVTVHWIPDIFSLRLVNHSINEIAGMPVLTLSETPLTGSRLLVKAIEDRVLALLILIAISPLLLIIAAAVKLDSAGPVFFRQDRNGWNGRTFKIWKFRSMFVHEPKGGVVRQAAKNDPRVTRVGRFLRRTSLDELPQLFNVLLGHMSLVGPRPHAVQHDEEYSQRIGDYFARHHIKPGITGLAQVRGFRGETSDLSQMVQRIESDIEYINNWSLWLDLTILLRTTLAFTGKTAY